MEKKMDKIETCVNSLVTRVTVLEKLRGIRFQEERVLEDD